MAAAVEFAATGVVVAGIADEVAAAVVVVAVGEACLLSHVLVVNESRWVEVEWAEKDEDEDGGEDDDDDDAPHPSSGSQVLHTLWELGREKREGPNKDK